MTTNIADIFVLTAEQKKTEVGIIEASTGERYTFGKLNSMSDRYATYFVERGMRPGNVVMLMVKPSADFVSLTLALFKIGTPVVLIDPGMGFKNLLRCIARVEPQFLVGIPKALLFSKIFSKHFKTIKASFCCGKSFGIFGRDIRQYASEKKVPFPVYQPGPEDLAAIIFTTGSTGPPKGVRYEHSVFAAQLRLVKEYYGINPQDIDQPAFPLFALFSAAIGACSVLPDMDSTKPAQVDPEKFIGSILKNNVTYSFGSPAIWNVVSNYCIKKNISLPSVKKVLMAGAPVPYDLIRRVSTILPEDAKIFTPYGATECLPIVSMESSEILNETWEKSKKGKGTCVGRPLPGIDIQIIAIKDTVVEELTEDLILGTMEKGEIIVRGDVVTKSYEKNPGETLLAKIRDGKTFWHRMGDIGYLDEQQRLWFCGRKAHRVETENETLFTIPCEAIVNEHPDVFRSALVGIKKNTHSKNQCPVLIVELIQSKNIQKQNVLSEIQTLARKSTLTQSIEHFLIHEKFPVDIRHNAKIFREKLAIWAQNKINP